MRPRLGYAGAIAARGAAPPVKAKPATQTLWALLVRRYPGLDVATLRWHLQRGDVFIGGRIVRDPMNGPVYTGGMVCDDPSLELPVGTLLCLCALITPYDSM